MGHGAGPGPQVELLLRALSLELSHSHWACCHLTLHTERGVRYSVCACVCVPELSLPIFFQVAHLRDRHTLAIPYIPVPLPPLPLPHTAKGK